MPLDLSRQAGLFPTSRRRGGTAPPIEDDLTLTGPSETTTSPPGVPGGIDTWRFTIIGCGGIGSNLANLIARLGGQRFALVDPDEVAEENIAPGWFNLFDLKGSWKKVTIIQSKLTVDFGISPENIQFYPERFNHQDIPSDVVLVCTDTIYSRRSAWRNRARLGAWHTWVDCRMGRDQASVYVVHYPQAGPHALLPIEQEYIADYEAALALPQTELPCGEKATAALTVGMIPGMVGAVLYRLANGRLPPKHLFFKMAECWWTCVEPEGGKS